MVKLNQNEIILERIRKYQEKPVFHPLTCANDSELHQYLKAEIRDDKVVLYCPDCDYEQHYIPEMFVHDEFDEQFQSFLDVVENLHKDK